MSRFKITSRQILFVLILLALAARLAYLLQLPNELLFGDAEDYWSCSENIVNGNGFSLQPTNDRLAHVPPAYPVFLAGLKILGISSLFYIRLVQIILSVSLIPIIYYLGKKVFPEKVIILTLLLYALSPHLVHWSTMISTESLAVFLFTVSFFAYTKGIISNDMKALILSVFLLALAALARSVFIFALPIFLLGVMVQGRARLRRIAILTGVFILVLLPWAARNYRLFNHIVPVTLGNGSAQIGKLTRFSPDYQDVLNQNDKLYQYHLHHYRHPQTPVEEYTSDKVLIALAKQMMKAHPGTTAKFFMWNLIRFWTPGATFYLQFYGEEINYIQFIPSFMFSGLLFPFVILGSIRLYRLNRIIFSVILLIFVYFTLVHSYLLGMLRYRMPLEVVFYLLASSGIVYLWNKLTSHHKALPE